MTKIIGFRNILINLGIILFFIVLSYAYLSPLLEGKTIEMDDIRHFRGMSKELMDYRDETGEEALWTNSMFGGMPAYMISTLYKGNIAGTIHTYLRKIFPVASMIFLYLVGFYILLTSLRVNRILSIAGAIAFAFSSYSIIIIGAGHITKSYALAYLAPVIAGVLLVYGRKYFAGTLLFTLFLALELHVNHIQITYYGLLLLSVYVLIQLITAIRSRSYKNFIKSTLFLSAGVLIAVGMNFSRLYTNWEYSKETIRGHTVLSSNSSSTATGLDKEYVVQWSYGIDETLTLLIPNFKGGSTLTDPGINSKSFKTLQQRGIQNPRQTIKAVSMYHGDQPFTSGPVYIGAIVMFLFVFGLFIVKGPVKWWLLIGTILSIILSWGGNIMWLTSFLLDHLPLYNKFRAPSMTLVIAQITIPMLGFIALNKIIFEETDKRQLIHGLKWSIIITGGAALLFTLIPGIAGNFSGSTDHLRYPEWLLTDMVSDRKDLLRSDAFRSFIFISLTAISIFLWHLKKIKAAPLTVVIALLILIDLWTVDKRYLNNDDFVSKREAENPFPMTQADQIILADSDLYYRVLPFQNPFQDARTSFYHKNIGGYHAAKLRRYQELIDHQIIPEMQLMVEDLQNNVSPDSLFINTPIINMLNTRYLLLDTDQPPIRNPNASGNAWFVNEYEIVNNADEEMEALDRTDPLNKAVIASRFSKFVEGKNFQYSSENRIELAEYQPNYLKYSINCKSEQLVIFSDIYYDKGWKSFIDDQEAPHFRADFVLRGMVVPAGQHIIEFKFKPASYYTGNKISLASSLLLLLAALGYGVIRLKSLQNQQFDK